MQVVGVSMAPGLRQGDQVRWSPQVGIPDRYDRVICQLAGSQRVLKRVLGIGGEELCFQKGEIFIDNAFQRKNIRQLASLGIPVISHAGGLARGKTGWFSDAGRWNWLPALNGERDWLIIDLSELPYDQGVEPSPLLYDDSPWLAFESRRLELMSDAGLAAVIKVDMNGHQPVEICLRVGGQAARILVQGCGQLAYILGQLDGRVVAAAWPVGGASSANVKLKAWLSGASRSAVPPDGPHEWAVVESLVQNESPFPVAISAQLPEHQQIENPDTAVQLTIGRLVFWRDVHWLPHANGQGSWTIPEGHLFLLGDCPAASQDSRHWGPLPAESVLGVVADTVPISQDR